jgi:amidophosphoribosyltransferase
MCGVFGVWGHPEAANIAYLGLHALQHRGQESAGTAAADGLRITSHRAMGLVQAAFTEKDLAGLPGTAAIGHVRYSTAGGSQLRNAQPFAVDYASGGSIALGHNGNLTNHEKLREELELQGSIYQTGSDTETILHLFARSRGATVETRIVEAVTRLEGAYSLVVLTPHELIAIRDPRGFRPLCIGKMRGQAGEDRWLVASEPTSFDLLGATFVRDVEPGEVVRIDDQGLHSSLLPARALRKTCLFEYVYFARPDSVLDEASVYEVRKALGRTLAKEHPLRLAGHPHPGSLAGAGGEPAVVIPVPDSGVPAAIGFAEASGLPFEMGLIRSHYVGRTFIEPQESIRHFGVRLKLHPNRAVIEGRHVIVVDDSIVRGTTSRKIVKMIREAGAKSVHVRISSPPVEWPCYYGINTPTRAELIASSHDEEEIGRYLEADGLGYLSLKGLVEGVAGATHGKLREAASTRFCDACFSGDYPVPFEGEGTIPDSNRRNLRVVAG